MLNKNIVSITNYIRNTILGISNKDIKNYLYSYNENEKDGFVAKYFLKHFR